MKRILITGANSYVGTNVEKWLMKEPDKYYVETLDMKDPDWKDFDFSKFDVVFHVAGIAHVSTKKSMRDLYFKVNRDLAFETAQKAKDSGVNQFIFMSSMSIYGVETGIINSETVLNPTTIYGTSKLQAEKKIGELISSTFIVTIIRAPMIYGYKSPGNYQKLSDLIKISPIFPTIKNKKSVIFILNLCEYIRLLIKNPSSKICFPQNIEFVSTDQIVRSIQSIHKKTILFLPYMRGILKLLPLNKSKKILNDLVYAKNISEHDLGYCIYEFSQTILIAEGVYDEDFNVIK